MPTEFAPEDAPEIVTFGCRLNSFETEVMRRHMAEAGLADLFVIHSCAVTAEAERQARQAVRRARRAHPGRRIVVTGCAAQVNPTGFAAMDEVDHVIGNADKLDPATWRLLARQDGAPREIVGDIMTVRETAAHLVDGFDGRTRAFLEVQQGCDHRCTFCIIPYGRGPSRSVPVARIVEQARRLVEHGYRELVVTGVDITSYGQDAGGAPRLGAMLATLLREVPDLPRLRLSSIDPAEIDPDLEALIADEARLMPHLHLSVQAGDDLTLKRMRRRHLRADVIRATRHLRRLRPGIVFGADLIAGFPTETDAMFENTAALVEEAGLTFLHVFPYSPRAGTPAARMPQIEGTVRRERAARLRALGDRRLEGFLQGEIGKRRSVLIERGRTARTEHFAPLRLAGADAGEVGAILDATITHAAGGMLEGRVER